MDAHEPAPHMLGPATKEPKHPITPLPLVADDMASVSSRSDTTASTTTTASAAPRPLDEERPPSKRQLITGHLRSFVIAFIRFASKGNNWALIVNLVHHLWGARKLITSKKYYYRTIRGAQPYARDAIQASRSAMHLTFATLSGLALKHRRMSTDRSTLLVLTLAAIGQAWAYAGHYWKSGAKYTIRALRQSGLLDALVFAVSSLAFSKTVRRSGRLL
ncbi:hypothetical protein BJV82DRAFT_618381 [Fennellomyces sp. T-0311]|nr:hypothetical protein BJV82DRAFT_618381 [Fennellomyces sp. T-0311]